MINLFENIENLFYSYGDVCKNIGKIETDGKQDNQKKYDRLCDEKENLMKDFKAQIKALKGANK